MIRQVTFSSNGKHFTATDKDIFMHNGARVVFIKEGKFASPSAPSIVIGNKEWQRIMPNLNNIDYETYYGRKPLMTDVRLYQVK